MASAWGRDEAMQKTSFSAARVEGKKRFMA
jgi:hypothetical protein